jgi:tetratricopeptide (TPR) repeat protein
MFGQFLPLRRCGRHIFTGIAVALTLCASTGCSKINEYQQETEVQHTLGEVDRQFTIEPTSDTELPHDKGPKKWISHALALMPHSAFPFVGSSDQAGIIDILELRGRYPLLIDLLKKAIADPKMPHDADYTALILSLAESQQRIGSPSDAEKTYAEAIPLISSSFRKAGTKIDPDSGIILEKARAEYYGGMRAQAMKDYHSIITTDPDNAAEAENDLAYMLALDKTDLGQANKLATTALAAARKDGNDERIGMYEDTLAWVDHQQGNDKDALYYEDEAAELLPLMADVQYHLGEITRANGQNFEARIAYVRAIRLDPFFPEARAALKALPPSAADTHQQAAS